MVVSHWLKAFGGVSWAENSSLFEVSCRGFTIDGVVHSRNFKFPRNFWSRFKNNGNSVNSVAAACDC